MRESVHRGVDTATTSHVMALLASVSLACCWGCCPPQKCQNSLWVDRDNVRDDLLLGTWSNRLFDSDISVKVERNGGNTYSVSLKYDSQGEEKTIPPCSARLLQIGQHLLVDVTVRDPKGGRPSHYFFRLGLLGNQLFLGFLDSDSMARRLKDNPKLLTHIVLERPQSSDPPEPDKPPPVLITADSAELRVFVRRHLEQSDLWSCLRFESEHDIPVGEDGLASKKSRTFNYWYAMMSENPFRQVTQFNGGHVPEEPAEWERLADSIDNLPTIGVDLDAVNSAREMARLCREVGEIFSRTSAKAWMAEAVARSLAGDPVGAIADRVGVVAQRLPEVATKMRTLRERLEDARVLLTNRYETEFPRIQ